MTITDKTRKLLWGKSGNRCAICKIELSIDKTDIDSDSIIGDECHIIAQNEGGPRFDKNFPKDQINDFYNLILLCKIHHKQIDDQHVTFSVAILRTIKQNHENWVKDKLGSKPKEENTDFLFHIRTGKELYMIVAGAHYYDFDYDETQDLELRENLRSFLQLLQDYGEISSDLIELGQRYEAYDALDSALKDIESLNFMVFGFRNKNTGIIRVLKEENPEIIKLNI